MTLEAASGVGGAKGGASGCWKYRKRRRERLGSGVSSRPEGDETLNGRTSLSDVQSYRQRGSSSVVSGGVRRAGMRVGLWRSIASRVPSKGTPGSHNSRSGDSGGGFARSPSHGVVSSSVVRWGYVTLAIQGKRACPEGFSLLGLPACVQIRCAANCRDTARFFRGGVGRAGVLV